ncbi:orcokinin peptides type A-like isoform X1 [Neocloeon triangulifer]|uniref:orcokinin peptides type A-like isoform X1 n=1 Tax=Neocloeon triangulifer TaxID=2078957 RepID=UPI00286EDCE8|nr:orcokinin peptides type A-like isoform X1 [Neocloeon triangulifer]
MKAGFNAAVVVPLALILAAAATAKPTPTDDTLPADLELQRHGSPLAQLASPRQLVLRDTFLQVRPRPIRAFDTLTGASFGTNKRGAGFDSINGVSFGGQKRNFDEIDRSAFDGFYNYYKRNFDEIDRTAFNGFYKRNFDEIDRDGFDGFYKRRDPSAN